MSSTQYNKKSILLDRKEGAGILYLLDSSPILPPLYSPHLGALNCPLIQCHALSIYPLQQLSEIILSIASILMIFYQHQFQEYFFLYLGPFSWHKSSLKIFQSKGREIFLHIWRQYAGPLLENGKYIRGKSISWLFLFSMHVWQHSVY